MKRMQRVFGDLDMLRYVDGRLDDERRAAFASHLAGHAEDAERATLWGRQSDVIRAAFANVAFEPIPVSLRLGPVPVPSRSPASPTTQRVVAEPTEGPRRNGATLHVLPAGTPDRRRPGISPSGRPQGVDRPVRGRSYQAPLTAALLFGILALVIVAAQGFSSRSAERDETVQPMADEAASVVARAGDAHAVYAVDPTRPVELPATQRSALATWINRRLGLPVEPANLQPKGWSLLGGRIVPGVSGPAALFVYENTLGDRLSVYVDRAGRSSPNAVTFRPSGGDAVAMTWGDGVLDYVVTVRNSLDWLSRNGMALKELIARAD